MTFREEFGTRIRLELQKWDFQVSRGLRPFWEVKCLHYRRREKLRETEAFVWSKKRLQAGNGLGLGSWD